MLPLNCVATRPSSAIASGTSTARWWPPDRWTQRLVYGICEWFKTRLTFLPGIATRRFWTFALISQEVVYQLQAVMVWPRFGTPKELVSCWQQCRGIWMRCRRWASIKSINSFIANLWNVHRSASVQLAICCSLRLRIDRLAFGILKPVTCCRS